MTSSLLVLGTAQLGSAYGVANKSGQPSQELATAIVKEAWECGIVEFDTAQAYGSSEEILGRALFDLGISNEAKIITKFHPDLDHLNYALLSEALDQSLERLKVVSLSCMMLHRQEMLSQWDQGLSDILNKFIMSGRVQNIGISVYSPESALDALNTDGINYVQLPTNILDRRFEKAGVFQLAREKRKRIYIRSIFLQGLLLMNKADIPSEMPFAMPVVEQVEKLSVDNALSRKELAMGYIKEEFPDARVVFGAETVQQVRDNCISWERKKPQSLRAEVKTAFNDVDEIILNPAL